MAHAPTHLQPSRLSLHRQLGAPAWAAVLLMILLMVSSAPAHAQANYCTRFNICTDYRLSSAVAQTQYNFSAVAGVYLPPTGMVAGPNTFTDQMGGATTAPVQAALGFGCVLPCGTSYPFLTWATAAAQTDYGLNRAQSSAGSGYSLRHQLGNGSAQVDVHADGGAFSAWRDVWSFSTNGHFSASVAVHGQSGGAASVGDGSWRYELEVLDVDNLSPDVDGFMKPTVVARISDGSLDEQRSAFASVFALDFNFVAGVTYVVQAGLQVDTFDGRSVDLFHTAQLQDVLLSDGAELDALSGHDYLAAVPEPAPAALLWLGLAAIGWCSRGRLQRRRG